MLSFHKQAFHELFEEDGLLVSATGLGLSQFIFSALVRLHVESNRAARSATTAAAAQSATTLLVINAERDDQDRIAESAGVPLRQMRVTSEVPASERTRLYRAGGAFFVSSRILIVDLLSGAAPPHVITGIAVAHAERVTEDSVEAFILRVFREGNRTGFVKCVSESPIGVVEFGSIEKLLSTLFVKRMFLWPRFRSDAKEALDAHPPDVVELSAPMSPMMSAIQLAILEIMRGCLGEITAAHSLGLDDELRDDDLLFASADRLIRSALDPIWSRVSPKTRQLVSDLTCLRKLLASLMAYDCVSFLQFLETLEQTHFRAGGIFGTQSVWLFSAAADRLFGTARARVFTKSKKPPSQQQPGVSVVVPAPAPAAAPVPVPSDGPPLCDPPSDKEKLPQQPSAAVLDGITEVLEENPKWTLLYQVLLEIEQEDAKAATGPPGTVLVIAKDVRACAQLQRYLCEGGPASIRGHFVSYLENKAARERQRQAEKQPVRGKRKPSSGSNRGRKGSSKRRAGTVDASASVAAAAAAADPESKVDAAPLDEESKADEGGFGDEQFTLEELDGEFGIVPSPFVVIRSLDSGESGREILEGVRPKYVVMYDPSLRFIRQVEVFKAENPGMPLRVYFLLYADSVEKRKFFRSVQREKDCFEKLIRGRATMVVKENQDGKMAPEELASTSGVPQAMPESMVHGGAEAVGRGPKSRLVLVDLREFRSSLPTMIHRRGLKVRPTHLEVGDYILSNDVAVERKSVSDLISSFASGRLFTQAEAMCRAFTVPILLIEWNTGQPFFLPKDNQREAGKRQAPAAAASATAREEISDRDTQAKLVLLAAHFPKLRLLWSRSPASSAELFELLKDGRPDPTLDGLAAVDEDEDGDSTAAIDFLTKLPGITERNVRQVIEDLGENASIARLSRMTKAELSEILRNDQAASRLASLFSFSSPN